MSSAPLLRVLLTEDVAADAELQVRELKPQALAEVFAAIQRFWKTLDFKVTDTIEQGSRVALFGSFTYKSNATGKEITSPFGLLARFEGDKIAYIQFLEDSYGTAGSFKTGGATRFHSDPSGKEVEI